MNTLLLGSGGHAHVCQSMASHLTFTFIQKEDEEEALSNPPCSFVNGIGVQGIKLHSRLLAFQRFKEKGFTPLSIISSHALFEGTAHLAEGVQVMAGAIVQTNVTLHENCVINTGASLDHGCIIHAHAFIAPRATLCGGVIVGEGAFLGAGCIVLPNIHIKPFSIIAAGEIVK